MRLQPLRPSALRLRQALPRSLRSMYELLIPTRYERLRARLRIQRELAR